MNDRLRVYLRPVGAESGVPLDRAAAVHLQREGDALVLYVNHDRTIWELRPSEIAQLIAELEGR